MIGQTIAHYTITAKIGEGGMGEIYLATDSSLGRSVALKFLPAALRTNTEARSRLLREARAASQLTHPNILTIYAVEEAIGRDFIVMEYLEGLTLSEYCQLKNPSLPDKLNLVRQIADGLAAAHKRGIVHRDIKPANILVDHDGHVKILDFGLAKTSLQTTKITQEGSTPGTAAYMAPEQARGDAVDARADLWSLGVVLYEILSGKLPFEGSHSAAVMYSVLHEPPRPLSELVSQLPSDLVSLIDRLLRKDPLQRPTDAKAVATELADIRSLLSGGAGSQPGGRRQALPSLAVLPFANMSTDVENEFFADGLTEDLITAFSKMENLRVVARTSAFQFKGKTSDVRHIGEQLSVGSVLEGSVRRSGNRLRVTAQLINVADGFHVWSERYDRELADVFEIQDDIARRIVDALRVKLLKESGAPLVQVGTVNMEAYHLFLQGRMFWNQRKQESLEKSVECFRKAVQLDPGYAAAHAGMALSYYTMMDHGFVSSAQLHRLGRPAAAEALRLDPESAEAHTAMGMFLSDDLDWDAAEKAFQKAIAANPGYATAHQWYASLLLRLGRTSDAIREMETARDADPLSLIVRGNLAACYAIAGQTDKARHELDKCLDQDPSYTVTMFFYGFLCEQMGQYNEAVDHYRRLLTLSPSYFWVHVILARFLYRAGRYLEAAESMETWAVSAGHPEHQGQLVGASRNGDASAFRSAFTEFFGTPRTEVGGVPEIVASFFVLFGDHDRAFAWLSFTAAADPHSVLDLKTDYVFEPLRDDPRYGELLRVLRLPVD